MKSTTGLAAAITTLTLTLTLPHVARAENEPPRTEMRVESAVLGGIAVASVSGGAYLFAADFSSDTYGGYDAKLGGSVLTGLGIGLASSSIAILCASFAPPSAKNTLVIGGAVATGVGLLASVATALLISNRSTETAALGIGAAGLGLTGAGAGLLTAGLRF